MSEDEKNLQPETDSGELSPEEAFVSGSSGERIRVRRLGKAPGQSPRRSSPINAIDVIVILLVLAVIAFFVVRGVFGGSLFKSKTETKTIEYTVVFRRVSEDFVTAVSSGNAVLNAKEKQSFGTVSADVESNPSTYVAYVPGGEEGAGGTATLLPYPGYVDLTVTIRVDAEYSEGTGYTVGGIRIAVGSEYSLMFPGFTGTGTCIALNDNLT